MSILISEEDLQKCEEVLKVLGANQSLYESVECRDIRKRLQPHIQKLSKGASRQDALIKQNHRQLMLKTKQAEQIEANQDKKFIANTRLRAGRMMDLKRVTAANSESDVNVPLVLDGAVDDVPCGNSKSAKPGSVCALVRTERPNDSSTQQGPLLNERRSCYICKGRFRELHFFYDSLCPMCSNKNYVKRQQSANLAGKVAIVTGARVKIGFHTGLKLLRAGATVVATSRFPADTARRYKEVSDFDAWRGNLHVYGLDFRDLRSVELFTAHVITTFGRVDVLVNNACQTIRRPRQYYAHMLTEEAASLDSRSPEIRSLLKNNDVFYTTVTNTTTHQDNVASAAPRIVGGCGGEDGWTPTQSRGEGVGITNTAVAAFTGALEAAPSLPSLSAELSQLTVTSDDALSPVDAAKVLPTGAVDINDQQLDLRKVNTWVQKGHEVETPEVAEVFAINTIAPFVLCSRLRSVMVKPASDKSVWSDAARAAEPHLAALRDDCLSLAEAVLLYNHSVDADTHARASRQEPAHDGVPTGKSKNSKAPKGRAMGIGDGASANAAACVHGAFAPPRLASETSFIVNVSSMEGKFYRKKTPNHPHTNMAKSALNMMTRTCADDYAADGIYMTCVDTGWINDENPLERAAATAARQDFATPLDEIDAAARILDPVFAALVCAEEAGGGLCRPVYGAFLKDYYASEW